MRAVALALFALVGAAACEPPSDRRGERTGAAGEGDGSNGAVQEERPRVKEGLLELEGTPESVRLTLYRTPHRFPLPFTTYLPPGIGAEHELGAGDGSVRFFTEFGGRRNPEAFLTLYVYPDTAGPGDAVSLAEAYWSGGDLPVSQGEAPPQPTVPPRFDWALAELDFGYPGTRQDVRGTIAVGSHAGRVFHVVAQHPLEYAEGFWPRMEIVLEELRWEDPPGRLEQTR